MKGCGLVRYIGLCSIFIKEKGSRSVAAVNQTLTNFTTDAEDTILWEGTMDHYAPVVDDNSNVTSFVTQ